MSTNQVSVVMMAKNAAETIGESLESLESFDEVLLYLNNSTDNTKPIAQGFNNVNIVEGEFVGFGKTKNIAVSHSKNDWILSLDSDEVLTKELVSEIENINLDDVSTIYQLKRDNYFLGYQTQSSDLIVRMFNKKMTQFNDNLVHEKVIVPHTSQVLTLKNHFIHYNITNINQTLSKIIQYTDLGAENKQTCFFLVVIGKSIFAFLKTYLIQRNIVKGWVGFALAINSANKRYYKYLKQYINCQEAKKKKNT